MDASSSRRTSKRKRNRDLAHAVEDKTQNPVHETVSADFVLDPAKLPPRLFVTGRYPPSGRINLYSKPEFLLDLVDALKGTPDIEYLKASCFGPLLELPVQKSSLSGKLVHQMLCRSLITVKRHEMWFIFGGHPFRFSLREFGIVTGLECGPYPEPHEITRMQNPSDPRQPYWSVLFPGDPADISIIEVLDMLKADSLLPHSDRMPSWRRRRLALIVIVEGVLICSKQPVRATSPIVEMVKDLHFFEAYPWGRESFRLTLRMLKLGDKCTSVELLEKKFNQSHTIAHGFPLAFQLFFFKAIPELERFLPHPEDLNTFTNEAVESLTSLKLFHNSKIMEVEHLRNLYVKPYLEDPTRMMDENVNEWDDEVRDESIEYLELLIGQNFKFTKDIWSGGYDKWPLISVEKGKAVKQIVRQQKPRGRKKNRAENVGQDYGPVDLEAVYERMDALNASRDADMRRFIEGMKKSMMDEIMDNIISELRHTGILQSKSKRVRETQAESMRKSSERTTSNKVVDHSTGDNIPVDEDHFADDAAVIADLTKSHGGALSTVDHAVEDNIGAPKDPLSTDQDIVADSTKSMGGGFVIGDQIKKKVFTSGVNQDKLIATDKGTGTKEVCLKLGKGATPHTRLIGILDIPSGESSEDESSSVNDGNDNEKDDSPTNNTDDITLSPRKGNIEKEAEGVTVDDTKTLPRDDFKSGASIASIEQHRVISTEKHTAEKNVGENVGGSHPQAVIKPWSYLPIVEVPSGDDSDEETSSEEDVDKERQDESIKNKNYEISMSLGKDKIDNQVSGVISDLRKSLVGEFDAVHESEKCPSIPDPNSRLSEEDRKKGHQIEPILISSTQRDVLADGVQSVDVPYSAHPKSQTTTPQKGPTDSNQTSCPRDDSDLKISLSTEYDIDGPVVPRRKQASISWATPQYKSDEDYGSDVSGAPTPTSKPNFPVRFPMYTPPENQNHLLSALHQNPISNYDFVDMLTPDFPKDEDMESSDEKLEDDPAVGGISLGLDQADQSTHTTNSEDSDNTTLAQLKKSGKRPMVADEVLEKRVIRSPKRFCRTVTPVNVVHTVPVHESFNEVDFNLKKNFDAALKKHKGRTYNVDGHTVPRSFFKDIATPQKWIDTPHVEALLSLIWRRHGEDFVHRGVAILNSWFIRILVDEHARYQKAGGVAGWKWNSSIKNSVHGFVPSRFNKLPWYSVVKTVYAPMNWGQEHWVGLVINLDSGKIDIYDSFQTSLSTEKVDEIMKPVDEILSLVVHQLVDKNSQLPCVPVAFHHARLPNVYQNKRSGDCGPLAVKFIELHAQGLPLAKVNDKMVDNMRTRYAIDLYEEYIQPLN